MKHRGRHPIVLRVEGGRTIFTVRWCGSIRADSSSLLSQNETAGPAFSPQGGCQEMTMASKASERQNSSQPRARKEPNLGQKDARQQTASEEELRQMGNQEPSSPGHEESAD